jgi:hypothetical protein
VGEDQRLEERVGGEAVGAVQSGAGDLADGEQSGVVRPSISTATPPQK